MVTNYTEKHIKPFKVFLGQIIEKSMMIKSTLEALYKEDCGSIVLINFSLRGINLAACSADSVRDRDIGSMC